MQKSARSEESNAARAHLHALLRPEAIRLLSGDTKQAVLQELVETMGSVFGFKDFDLLNEAIFRREELMSTGIGLGIAVPHVRLAGVGEMMVVLGVQPDGIADYDSIDGAPVNLILMIVAGEGQHAEHLKLLATIVTALKDDALRSRILKAASPEEIYELLK